MQMYKRYNSEKGMCVIKKYRNKYKMTIHRCLRIKGMEECDLSDKIEINNRIYPKIDFKKADYKNISVYVDDLTGLEYYDYDIEPKREEKRNSEKLANNISRARALVYELGICNDWKLFCTFTLDKTKYDRYDLSRFKKDFSQKIRDLNKKYNCKIKYILIPEKHKDGAWHMHGLMSGIPECELQEFSKEEHLPLYILEKIIKGETIYSWKTYKEKFGFCDLEPIKDLERAVAYILKYITKSMCDRNTELGAHLYYASQKLNRASEVQCGFLWEDKENPLDYTYENEYVKVKWLTSEEYDIIKEFVET